MHGPSRPTDCGVNAPTFPLNLAGQKQLRLWGLSVPEILYLIAVAALWHVVGHFRDYQEQRGVAISVFHVRAVESSPLRSLAGRRCYSLQVPQAFAWNFAFGRVLRPTALINAVLYAVWSLAFARYGFRHFRTHSTRSYPFIVGETSSITLTIGAGPLAKGLGQITTVSIERRGLARAVNVG